MYSIKNKVAIVTGGANGIGASIVKEFVDEGAKFVAIIDIDNSGAKLENELVTKYGENITRFFHCDITEVEQLLEIFSEVTKEHGYIDIVVNNAGTAVETIDKYIKAIAVNFTATVTSSLKALDLMRVDQGGKGGTIINVSSIVALSHNFGQFPIYAGTKSAILQFSSRLGMDDFFPRTNVRVLTLCFGPTDTNILRTCRTFDEKINLSAQKIRDVCQCQTSEEAALGVVHSYKVAKSGSAWLINNAKTIEITDKIKRANEIMSEDVTF